MRILGKCNTFVNIHTSAKGLSFVINSLNIGSVHSAVIQCQVEETTIGRLRLPDIQSQ